MIRTPSSKFLLINNLSKLPAFNCNNCIENLHPVWWSRWLHWATLQIWHQHDQQHHLKVSGCPPFSFSSQFEFSEVSKFQVSIHWYIVTAYNHVKQCQWHTYIHTYIHTSCPVANSNLILGAVVKKGLGPNRRKQNSGTAWKAHHYVPTRMATLPSVGAHSLGDWISF